MIGLKAIYLINGIQKNIKNATTPEWLELVTYTCTGAKIFTFLYWSKQQIMNICFENEPPLDYSTEIFTINSSKACKYSVLLKSLSTELYIYFKHQCGFDNRL